ncbi:MAG: GWxTD domain-containing protein [Calditrichaeota bacterium]|nr:MAG: hypothetical protein DWQ03_04660 [Calditrichota bacterium]MBL1204219.1 GWxTD domain-containing protein [Calditrichota bacterium]NOG44049.1 GWxTD domain-containing protein [Calditrichota bacterium]
MKKTKFILLKTVLLIFPFFSYGQVSFIPISADYSAFQMNDSLAYVEFYVSFFQSNLQYDYKNDTLQALFENKLIINHNGDEIKNISHNFKNTETDSASVKKYSQFYDIFSLALPFRHFSATIRVTDKISGFTGEYILDINIPGATNKFRLSDIQLSSHIEKTTVDGKFTKNNLKIIPYPRKVYDLLQPMLYYYVELNNLSYSETQQNKYNFNYFVTNENGDTLKTGPQKTNNIAGNAQVEIGAFNALSLPPGSYNLNIRAKDLFSGNSSNTRKRFSVRKPRKKKVLENQLSDIDPVFNSMNLEELKEEFEAASYFATLQETEIFEQLVTANEIRVFLTTFWRNLDKQNGIAFGLTREKFLRLFFMANNDFSSSMVKGYKTDRGRVLILYGIPSEIERFTNNTDTDPYVIWNYYELDGGSKFIFGDRSGFGRYELLHSTYYKEIQNPDWYDRILIPNYKRTND